MNRQQREIRDDLYRRLNKVVDEIAQEKGVTRQELLQRMKDFPKAPNPVKHK